jgi:hypothetical protein
MRIYGRFYGGFLEIKTDGAYSSGVWERFVRCDSESEAKKEFSKEAKRPYHNGANFEWV